VAFVNYLVEFLPPVGFAGLYTHSCSCGCKGPAALQRKAFCAADSIGHGQWAFTIKLHFIANFLVSVSQFAPALFPPFRKIPGNTSFLRLQDLVYSFP
jgi:hypothetical protein